MAKISILVGGSGRWTAHASRGGVTKLASGHIPHRAPWDEVLQRQLARQARGDADLSKSLGGGHMTTVEVPDWVRASLLKQAAERMELERYDVYVDGEATGVVRGRDPEEALAEALKTMPYGTPRTAKVAVKRARWQG